VFPSRLLPGTRNRYVNPYIGAADAYVSYPVERSLRSGDCGIISPVEALSCGTPVVSPVLRFIPAEEREAVGALPAEPPAFAGAIEAVLSDPPEQTDCVRTASRHFSWREVAADIAAVYDERL
jgi:glycosyltransferase involved in cell wall biosynthesis